MVWKWLEDEVFEPDANEEDANGCPGCMEASSSANDSPCLIMVQWTRTESGWGFITNWRKSEAFGM